MNNLGVIKQQWKGEFRCARAHKPSMFVECTDTGSCGQAEKLQKEKGEKRVRKEWEKGEETPLFYSQWSNLTIPDWWGSSFSSCSVCQWLQRSWESRTEVSWAGQPWRVSCPPHCMFTPLALLCAFYWSGARVTNGLASQPPWKCHAGVNKNTRCMFYKELQLALNDSGFHLSQPSLVLWVSMDEQEGQEMIQWASEFPSSWTWQPQTYLFTLPLPHTLHSKLLCNLRVLSISDLNSFSLLISDESC